MSSADICVITPTVRNPEFIETYVENAKEHGFDLDRLFIVMVTEDFCEKDEMRAMLDRLGVDGAVFGGTERDRWYEENGIGEYADIVPAASHAETSFGLLYMWANPQFDYGIFLDDDTEPHPDFDFFGDHLDHLGATKTVEHVASDENWVNVLYQNIEEHGLYPRGYPYSAMDETIATKEDETSEIIASQGLWTNIPDLDAVRILMDGDLKGQAQTLTDTDDFSHNFAAAEGNYLTVCSMNLAFQREVIPAFYQFPMDDNEWDIGRFDDIWSGLTLKKAADMLDKSIINGFPLCIHNKAERSTFSDLNNEVPALELNEHFWEALAEAPETAEDYIDAYEKMIDAVDAYDFSDYANDDFIDFTVEKMKRWLAAIKELDRE
ncbi:MAG: alpha-1 4-glucan-protein synthase [Candidatus Nanohaloarchaeota archaeon QJJ-5]|nr:alpha-1 4-glucan-protein synthase [Candidatus Nanohaloarchaeota archaeon QJJ-5]